MENDPPPCSMIVDMISRQLPASPQVSSPFPCSPKRITGTVILSPALLSLGSVSCTGPSLMFEFDPKFLAFPIYPGASLRLPGVWDGWPPGRAFLAHTAGTTVLALPATYDPPFTVLRRSFSCCWLQNPGFPGVPPVPVRAPGPA